MAPSSVGVILTTFTCPSDSSVCLHSMGVPTFQLLSFFSFLDGPCSVWSYILSEAIDLGMQSHLKTGRQRGGWHLEQTKRGRTSVESCHGLEDWLAGCPGARQFFFVCLFKVFSMPDLGTSPCPQLAASQGELAPL